MRNIFKLLVAAIMFVLLVPSGGVWAEGGGEEKEIKTFDWKDGFNPFQGVLSGPAWLMVEEDLVAGPQAGPSGQAGGGGGVGSVPYRSPAPAFSRNLLLSRDSGVPIHTEAHIAVNPNDKDHLVMAEIDYALRNDPAYVSFDGGENWEGPIQVPLTKDGFAGGDPVVGFDRQNRPYQAFMSMGVKSYDLGPFIVDLPTVEIAVASSQDGGLNWDRPTTAARNKFVTDFELDQFGMARGLLFFNFLDKPWMDIGPNPDNPKEDVIHVTYTEFAQYYSLRYSGELVFLQPMKSEVAIMAVSSTDYGKTWSDPQEVGPRRKMFEVGEQEGEEIIIWTVQGSQPKVAKDGTSYIVWYDSTEDGFARGKARIYLAKSEDAGKSWGDPVMAVEYLEGKRSPDSVRFRNSSFLPQLAVGSAEEIYVMYSGLSQDKPTDDGDIYFVRSKDGEDFTSPERINQDKTNRLQFFPAMATDPAGNIHAMWGDMRDDPVGLKYHIYYTISLDGGETWGFELKEGDVKERDTRVTDFPSNPNRGFPGGRFIGDYFAIAAASEEDVYLVWADTRLGEYGPMSQRIGFARRNAIPSPDVFLNPPRGPGGQEVTLQAFGFQPQMDTSVLIGGRVTPIGRANDDGFISFRIFMPISSEGSHEVIVFDDSGNVAQASYYTDFGFSDLAGKEAVAELKDENKALNQRLDDLINSSTESQDKESEAMREALRGVGESVDSAKTIALITVLVLATAAGSAVVGFVILWRRMNRRNS